MGALLATAAAALTIVPLAACSSESKIDPLTVVASASISNIEDNTATDWYTVTSADLEQTGFSTELKLGFDITNANNTKFSPFSTITFTDGSVMTCEADDVRRVPSLVKTTDTWDFACDSSIPDDPSGARISIIDKYND